MTTHDASDRAHRAPVRDPRAAATAAAVQAEFAAVLGVAAETYRTWDAGRRAVPEPWLNKARQLVAREDPARLWSMEALAAELGVHVRTLRNAARSGTAVRDVRASRLVRAPRAPSDACGRPRLCRAVLQAVLLPDRPDAYAPSAHPGACRLATTAAAGSGRPRTHPNPAGPADRGGGKAVVYQWEARKRRPSPVFWTKIEHLRTSGGRRHRLTDDREPSNRALSTRPAPGPLVLADLVGRHPCGPRLSAEERGQVEGSPSCADNDEQTPHMFSDLSPEQLPADHLAPGRSEI